MFASFVWWICKANLVCFAPTLPFRASSGLLESGHLWAGAMGALQYGRISYKAVAGFLRGRVNKPKECDGISELKRKPVGRNIEPMRVATSMINLGGVHVVIDLSPEDRVLNQWVTGVVPDESDGEASLKGISTW